MSDSDNDSTATASSIQFSVASSHAGHVGYRDNTSNPGGGGRDSSRRSTASNRHRVAPRKSTELIPSSVAAAAAATAAAAKGTSAPVATPSSSGRHPPLLPLSLANKSSSGSGGAAPRTLALSRATAQRPPSNSSASPPPPTATASGSTSLVEAPVVLHPSRNLSPSDASLLFVQAVAKLDTPRNHPLSDPRSDSSSSSGSSAAGQAPQKFERTAERHVEAVVTAKQQQVPARRTSQSVTSSNGSIDFAEEDDGADHNDKDGSVANQSAAPSPPPPLATPNPSAPASPRPQPQQQHGLAQGQRIVTPTKLSNPPPATLHVGDKTLVLKGPLPTAGGGGAHKPGDAGAPATAGVPSPRPVHGAVQRGPDPALLQSAAAAAKAKDRAQSSLDDMAEAHIPQRPQHPRSQSLSSYASPQLSNAASGTNLHLVPVSSPNTTMAEGASLHPLYLPQQQQQHYRVSSLSIRGEDDPALCTVSEMTNAASMRGGTYSMLPSGGVGGGFVSSRRPSGVPHMSARRVQSFDMSLDESHMQLTVNSPRNMSAGGAPGGYGGSHFSPVTGKSPWPTASQANLAAEAALSSPSPAALTPSPTQFDLHPVMPLPAFAAPAATPANAKPTAASAAAPAATLPDSASSRTQHYSSPLLKEGSTLGDTARGPNAASGKAARREAGGDNRASNNDSAAQDGKASRSKPHESEPPPRRRSSLTDKLRRVGSNSSLLCRHQTNSTASKSGTDMDEDERGAHDGKKEKNKHKKKRQSEKAEDTEELESMRSHHSTSNSFRSGLSRFSSRLKRGAQRIISAGRPAEEAKKHESGTKASMQKQQQSRQQAQCEADANTDDKNGEDDDDAAAVATELPTLADTVTTSATMATLPPHELATPLDVARQGHSLSGLGPAALSPAKLQTARSSPSHALQSSSVDGSIDFHTDVEDSKARQQQQMAMSSDGSTRPAANAPAAVIRLESELSLPRQEERDQADRSGTPAAAGGSGGHGQQRRGRSEGPQTESEVDFRMEEEEEPQVVEAAPMPAAVKGQRSPRRTGRHRRRRHRHRRGGGGSGGDTRAEKVSPAQRNASSSASSSRSSASAGSDDSSYSSDGRAGSTTSLTSADVLRQKERARRRRRRQQQQRDAEAQKRERATKTKTMRSERNGEQDQKTSTRVKAKKRQKTDSASLAHLARQHTRLGEESPDVYEAAEAYVRRRIARSCERAGSRDSASADGEGSRARRADRRSAATDAEELAVSAAQLAARRRALLRQSRVPSTVDHFLVAWHERTAARHRGWLLDAAAVRERKRRAQQLRRERRLRSQDEAVAAAVAAAASRSASRAHAAAATATSPRAAHTPHRPSVTANGNGDVVGDAPVPSASRRVHSSPRSLGTASMRRLDMAEAALQRQLAELDAHMEKRRRHRLWEERSPSAAAVGARAASGAAQGGEAAAAQQQPQQEGGKQAAASRQHGARAAPSSRAAGFVTPGPSTTAPHAHQQPASSRASISATTSYAHQLMQSSRRHQGSVNASADREVNAVVRSRGDSSPAPRKPPASARFAPPPSRDAASSSSMHNATLYEHQHSPLSALPSAAADREGSEWARETPRTAAAVSTAALQQRYEALLDTLLDEVEREEGAVAEGSRERKETSTGTAGSTTRPSAALDDRKRPSLRQRGSMLQTDVANRRPSRYSVSLWNAQEEEEEQALRCAEALRSEFYQTPLPPVTGGANQTSEKDHRVTSTTQWDDQSAAAAAKVLEQLEVSYAQSLRPSCSSCRPQQLDEYVTLGLLSVLHSLEMHNTRSGNGLHFADGTSAQKSAAGEAGAGAHARHKSSQRSSRLLQRGIREELYAAPKPSQRRKRIHQQELQEEALRHSPHKSQWVGNTVDQAAVALASAPLTRSPCGVPQPAPHPFTPPPTIVFAALLSRLLKAEAQGRQRIEQEEAGEERRTLHRLYIVETVCFLRALHAREQEAVVVVPVLTRRSLRDALARSSDDPHSVHEPVTPAVVQSSGPWRVPAASSSASSGTRSGGDRRHDGFPAGKGAAAGRHSSDNSEEGEEEGAEYGRIDTADRHRRVRSWRGATPPPSPRQHAGHFTDGSDGTSVPRSSRTCTAALESSRGGEAALSSGARSRHGDPDAATQCGSHSDRPAPSPLMPVPMMTSLQQPREARNQESGDPGDDGGAGAAGKDAPRSASGGGRLKVSSQTSLCTAAEKNAAPSDLSPQSATEEAERSKSAHSWSSSSSSSSRFSFATHDADQPLANSKPVFPDTAKQAEERDGSRRAIASESTEDSSTPLFELQESSRSTSAGEEGSPPSASMAQTPIVRPDEKKVGDSASTDHANAAPLTATEPEPVESSARHDGKVEKTKNSTEAGKRSTHSPSSSSPSSSSSLEFQLDEDDNLEEEKQREDSATESQDDEAAPALRPAPAADATPLTSTPVMAPLQDGKEKEHMERGDGIEEKGSRSSSASLSVVQERGEDAGVADRVPNAAETTANVRGDESDREVVGAVASASTSPLPPQEAPAPVATSQQRGVPAQSDSEVTPDGADFPSASQTALDASRRPLSIDRGDHNSQSANSAATSSASLPSTSSSSSSLVSLPLQESHEEATDLDKAEAAEEAEMESALAAAATHGRVDDTQNPVDSAADSAQSPHSTPSSPSHQEENAAINAADNLDDEDGALADPFTEQAPPAHHEGEKRDSDEDDDGDRFVVHTRVVEATSASAVVDHAAAATANAPNEAEALMESSEAASAPFTQRGEQPEQSGEPTPSSPSSSMAEDGAQPPLLLQQEQEAEDTAGHTVEGVEHNEERREAADRVEGGQGEQDGSSASDTHGTAETTQHHQQQQQQRPRRVRFSLPLEHAHKHHDNGEDNAEEEKRNGVDAADAERGREMGDATGPAQDGLTGVPLDAATPEKLTGRSAESSAEQHSRLTKAQGNIAAEEEEKGGDDDDSVSEKTAVELLEKLNGLDALLLYKFPTYFTKGTDTDGLPGAVMRRGRDTYTPRRSMSHRTSLADAQPAVKQRAADSSGQELPSADVGATVSRGSNGSAPASGSVSPARAPAGTLQHTNSAEATAATQAAAAASGAASPSPSAERSTALAPPRLPAESLATQLRRKYGLRQPRPLTALLPPSVSPAASTSSQPGAPALEHVYPRRLSHDVPVLPSPLHTYAAAHHPPTAQGAGREVPTALGSAAASLSKGRDVRRSSAAAMTSEDTRRATSESLDGAAPYAPHVKDLPSPEPHPPAQEEEEGGGGRHHQHQHPQYVMRDESVRAEHASEEMRAADSVAAPLVFSSVDRHVGPQRTLPVPSSTPLAGANRDSDKAALLLHQPRENTKEVLRGSHAGSDGGAAQAHRGSPPPVMSIPATTASACATLHRVPSSQRVHSDESSTSSDSSPLTVSIGGERKKQQQQRSTTTEGAVAVGQSSPPEPPATAPPRRASEWF